MILNKQRFHFELTRDLHNFSYEEIHHDLGEDEFLCSQTIDAKRIIESQISQNIIKPTPKFCKSLLEMQLMNLCVNNSINYKIDSHLLNVLMNTDAMDKTFHLPNTSVYLDIEIPTQIGKIMGIFMMDTTFISIKDPKGKIHQFKNESEFKDSGYNIYFLNYVQSEDKYYLNSLSTSELDYRNPNFVRVIKDEGEIFDIEEKKGFNQMFKGIVYLTKSFLNFLYNPDVEICKHEYTPIRKKRKEEQGNPVEDYHYLKITGKTRKYIDNLDVSHFSEEYLKLNKTVLVRGYYKTLSSDFYKEKRGQVLFIAPYIKGEGDFQDKEYIVSDKKYYYHEELMKRYVRELFPNHLVLDNTRGFLDGLEIDCYIPSLRIGFEYNGEQHYNFTPNFHKNQSDFVKQLKRDKLKNKLAVERGIKLITVRYDEDLTKELIKNKIGDIN